MAQAIKILLAMRKTQVRSPGWVDLLEKGMVTHSSILSWRIPWARGATIHETAELDMTEQLTQHNRGEGEVARTTGLRPPGRSWSQGSSGGSECFSAVMRMHDDGDLQITSPQMSRTCPGLLLVIAKRMPLLLSHDSGRTLGFMPGFFVYGISQARILEWIAISDSRGSSRPRDRAYVSCVSCFGRQILYH